MYQSNEYESPELKAILDSFERHAGSMRGGFIVRSYMYRLGVKQIVLAVGGAVANLTQDSVEHC